MLQSKWAVVFALFFVARCGSTDVIGDLPDTGPVSDGGCIDGSRTDGGNPGTPGILVTPTNGLRTTEAGGTATFTVVLQAQPTANVVVGLSSSDTGEGTVSPASLTFTTVNWNAPQTVTITGVDDDDVDGNQTFTIRTAMATSTDARYSVIDPADVTVSNTDNETAAVIVTPVSGLITTEAGGTATFTVELVSAPTADVSLTVSSDTPTEASVMPLVLTFTPTSWSSAQVVTVTGIDDESVDGDATFTILSSATDSADADYDGLDVDDVTGVNRDDETPGVVVEAEDGLHTSEAGDTATFTVALQSRPTADVAVAVESSDTTEGTLSVTSLSFTPDNWDIPQTVVVTGVDDPIVDGDQEFTVSVGPSTSIDTDYEALSGTPVTLRNADDETAGLVITPETTLITTEGGGTATFTIALRSQPSADVTLAISSSNPAEGTVSPGAVVFTAADWATEQTVTVTGRNDSVVDGDQLYGVLVRVDSSDDANYAALTPVPVQVSNTDDETAGVTVNPSTGLTTTEAGGTAMFSIVLNSQPTADVTIDLTSDLITEGTVAPASLTFGVSDWNVPQTVTVSGVDDFAADGGRVYHIVTGAVASTDPNYSGLLVADATITNTDDDVVGVVVSPTSGLTTSESGATTTFTIALTSEPTADVTLALSSSNSGEGTVSPASVAFTPANWNIPQVVTVSGVDDSIADGLVTYSVVVAPATSADAGYSMFNAPDVMVTNSDNDVAGIVATPSSGLTTTEALGVASFSVVLTSQPTSAVTIALTSSDTTEGSPATTTLTFTSANWNVPQTASVRGVDDSIDDGHISYTVALGATSSDAGYSGLGTSVSLTNEDDDTSGIVVSTTSGLVTTESGGTATFTVRLGTQPTASVTITLSSSDATEGSLTPTSLTFTGVNWNTPQTVTVVGVDDATVDGNIAYTIVTSDAVSGDPTYSSISADDVSVTNNDNDVASVTVSPTAGLITTEAGGTAMFTVALGAQPEADVTIALSSSNTAEGTVAPSTLTFTSSNWNVTQTVTVTGASDQLFDGDVAYTIVTGATTSSSASYNGIAVSDVSVTNQRSLAQTAYVKASNTAAADGFSNVALSADGNTLAVGATGEDSAAVGIDGDQTSNAASSAGGVYVFARSGSTWTQQAYIKASNAGTNDLFGANLALSSDGSTLAVGAYTEASNATGIGGDQTNNAATNAGAVYVFTRASATWSQEAYVKASNAGASDNFGYSLGLSGDGNTLAVGAYGEASAATGINGNQASNTLSGSGAAYVFVRAGSTWTQEAYIKASNAGMSDYFGRAIAISADGDTVGVGAYYEGSAATGIGGNQLDNTSTGSGAAYIFRRTASVWAQEAYIKASNTGANDSFGLSVALSGDGSTFAVGAFGESSNASGVGGDQTNNSAANSGAVYVFARSGATWSQQAYVKASNPGANDFFGWAVALSADGNTLAAGATGEASAATGIGGSQTDNTATNSGAVYLLTRAGSTWTQYAYVKASNTNINDRFGTTVAMSANGSTVAVGAPTEASTATGVGGDQTNNAATGAGAAYTFTVY